MKVLLLFNSSGRPTVTPLIEHHFYLNTTSHRPSPPPPERLKNRSPPSIGAPPLHSVCEAVCCGMPCQHPYSCTFKWSSETTPFWYPSVAICHLICLLIPNLKAHLHQSKKNYNLNFKLEVAEYAEKHKNQRLQKTSRVLIRILRTGPSKEYSSRLS